MASKNTTPVKSSKKIKVLELYFLGYSSNEIAVFLRASGAFAAKAIFEYNNSGGFLLVESKINNQYEKKRSGEPYRT